MQNFTLVKFKNESGGYLLYPEANDLAPPMLVSASAAHRIAGHAFDTEHVAFVNLMELMMTLAKAKDILV